MYSHCICSPETGITLFVNQRGYVHSEPPAVICTVVVVVDITARRQRFRAASLLPRMMSANDGRGGGADEPFQGAIAVAAQSRQCSGSIVLLRCASHGHCSHFWPSSSRNCPFLASSRRHCPPPPARKTLVRGGKHTTTTAGSIGGAIRATYDARSKSHAFVRPSSPPSMPSSIFSP